MTEMTFISSSITPDETSVMYIVAACDLTPVCNVSRSPRSSNKVEDPERQEGHSNSDLEGSKERWWFTCNPLQRGSPLLGQQWHPEGVLEEVKLHTSALLVSAETRFENMWYGLTLTF